MLYPYNLTWAEADPATHPFDAAGVEGVVRAFHSAMPKDRFEDKVAWCDELTEALATRYGPWASGWRWARDEGDLGGGPVSAWCCPRDSMKSPDQALRSAASALCEWRAWLERLAARFDEHPLPATDPVARHRVWRRAAIELIAMVVDQTGAGDAWYAHCQQVLSWYLARWDVPDKTARKAVGKAIGGRFESWVGPPEDVVTEVVERLRLA
ncbi:hypothetical protein [Labedaea rhizosphaerae]|uniref:Uncharacterized protein n=1 Tax=Labedaea rhizosphaerae TaxID=598644 RepID=A0A4R6S6I6_LABRH|nr:hypothetical protein [Labedaea rhizosphaerae]TDP94807.1 hypothetical protein EV186_10539 [Labedaea rhizosphaerae]